MVVTDNDSITQTGDFEIALVGTPLKGGPAVSAHLQSDNSNRKSDLSVEFSCRPLPLNQPSPSALRSKTRANSSPLSLGKLSRVLRILRLWAELARLQPRETIYLSWTPDRHRLRFTKTGDQNLERTYRTHWISPDPTATRRRRTAR